MTKFNPRSLDRIKYEQGIRTDTELAAQLGVNRSTVSRWREGGGSPTFAAVSQMVLRFGIPYADLTIQSEEAAA